MGEADVARGVMGVEAGTVDECVVAEDAGLGGGNGVTVWAASPPQPASKIRPAARITNNTDVNAMQRFTLNWKGLIFKCYVPGRWPDS